MGYPDLDEARARHCALRDTFLHERTDWSDRATLRDVEAHCRAAIAALDDAYCREELGIIADYAAELVVRGNQGRWASESLSGSEFLRLQILKALDSFQSRLYSLEALRRAGEAARLTRPGSLRDRST